MTERTPYTSGYPCETCGGTIFGCPEPGTAVYVSCGEVYTSEEEA